MRYLLLTLMLTGCGEWYFGDGRVPDFTTRAGVAFHLNGQEQVLDQKAAEAGEAFAWKIWGSTYGTTAEVKAAFDGCLEGAWVEFYAPEHFSGGRGGQYSGGPIELTDLDPNPCQLNIPYYHEIIHLQQWCQWKEIDMNHQDYIWTIMDQNDSLWMFNECNP